MLLIPFAQSIIAAFSRNPPTRPTLQLHGATRLSFEFLCHARQFCRV